jgi:hypothetical protein
MASAHEVRDFIAQLTTCIEFGSKAEFRRTAKNIQGLATLNLTEAEAIQLVCRFTSDNYCGGPEPDADEDGKKVWKFGFDMSGVEVYVKIRLDASAKRRAFLRPVIRSFHPAEHPLHYPLRRSAP